MQAVIFHSEAKDEMRLAANWHEERRSGFGEIFMAAVESAVRQIQMNPYGRMKIRGDARRILLHKFPYGIIYVVEQDVIVILALMHLRRNPDYWIDRLTNLPE